MLLVLSEGSCSTAIVGVVKGDDSASSGWVTACTIREEMATGRTKAIVTEEARLMEALSTTGGSRGVATDGFKRATSLELRSRDGSFRATARLNTVVGFVIVAVRGASWASSACCARDDDVKWLLGC